MQTPGENDEFFREITRGMSCGDEDAYRRFYESCFDRLYRYLLLKTRGDENMALEFAQIVLVRIVRYIKPFPAERIFWAWVYQLCRSVQVDWLRRNGKPLDEELFTVWQEQAVSPTETDEELLRHLENAMDLLDFQDRQLVQLAYFEAVPHRTIAERTQSTPKAIESKLARVRQKLRKLIIDKLKEYALF